MSVKAATEKNFRRAKVKPSRKKGVRGLLLRRTVVMALVAGLGLYGAYRATNLALTASVLGVQVIAVEGNERLTKGEVQALLDGLRGQNILTASLDDYRQRLLESPWVADASLRRVLPGTVQVVITERHPIGLCRLRNELYLLDRDGTIIDEYGPAYAEFDLPIIDGVQRKQPRGEPVIDERRSQLAALLIDDASGRKGMAARISQIDVSDLHNAVVLLDDDPTRLHVGTERFADRLQNYLELAPTLRETVPEMDYVDLRFEGRLFVKPAGSAVVQVTGRSSAKR